VSNLKTAIEAHFSESARVKAGLAAQSGAVLEIIQQLAGIITQGGRIYACGNGGSACDAMHFVEELVARYDRDRPGIPAQHLLDLGIITCWSNDYEFESVFSRQVETLVTNKDAIVVFSTSGNSANILKAMQSANLRGALVVGLLGKGGGKAKELAKLSLVVDSASTAHIQESHIALVHVICAGIQDILYPTR